MKRWLASMALLAWAASASAAEVVTPDGELHLTLAPVAASVCVRWPVEARNECSGDFAAIDAQAVAGADRIVSSSVVRHLDWSYQLVITKELYAAGRDLDATEAKRLVIETRDEWQATSATAFTIGEPSTTPGSKAYHASIDGPRSHDEVYFVASGKNVYVMAFHLSNESTHTADMNTEAADAMRTLVTLPPVAGVAETAVVDLGKWMSWAAGAVVVIIAVGIFLTMRFRKPAPPA